MKKLTTLLTVLMLAGLAWAKEGDPQPRVRLQTRLGAIVLQMESQAAPQTVANFLAYVRDGFYDGTLFHRVIKGFMIQGGGLDTRMQRKPTRDPIKNEADNGLKNIRGTVAMARTNQPNSATGQFFINTVDNPNLDHSAKTSRGWGYCVFAQVVEGMAVVDRIEGLPTTTRAGRRDVPAQDVVVERATMVP